MVKHKQVNRDLVEREVDQEMQELERKFNQKKAVTLTDEKEEENVQSKRIKPKTIQKRLFNPREYKDTKDIANALVNGQIAYVYLTKLSKHEAGRIVDFLTGVAYGVNGDIQRINGELFIVTPADIEITNDLLTL